jgi:phospholipase/carboxylesterase
MDTTLEYIERLPKKLSDAPAPLLILLHGYGSNEMDLYSFAEELPDTMHIISLQAPHNLGGQSFAWYSINFDADQNKFSDLDEARVSLEKIETFVEECISSKNINPEKVFVLGFSQGAILSYALSLKTQNIQHVIALSGYLNEELIPKNMEASTTDYFISHGSVDQVIPVEWARKAPAFFKEHNIEHSYKEYPVGHGVHPQNFYDFKAWIEERL